MISEEALARQRLGPRVEVQCPGCGRQTTDRTGTCVHCRRANGLRWERMTVDQLGWIVERAREELRRRQEEIGKLLGEEG